METIAVLLVIAGVIVWLGRRPRHTSGPVRWDASTTGGGTRRSAAKSGAVVSIPAPAGWPRLPVRSGQRYVPAAERAYARTTCPSCEAEMTPLPKAKKRCRDCGATVLVRNGEDGLRHIVAESQLGAFTAAQRAEGIRRQDEADAAWERQLRELGIQTGDYELDVVGESYRHTALAGIRTAILGEGDDSVFEVDAVAALVPEPSNRHDRNAVRVDIHGEHVGYLSREDAEDYQPVLRRVRGPFFVQAQLLGGQRERGRIGPIGVRLVDLPEP